MTETDAERIAAFRRLADQRLDASNGREVAGRRRSTPEGYYNIGRMMRSLVGRGVVIGCCGSCLDARGYGEADLAEGT